MSCILNSSFVVIELEPPSIPQDLDYYIPTPKSTPYPPQLVDMTEEATYIPGIGVEAYDPTKVAPMPKPHSGPPSVSSSGT